MRLLPAGIAGVLLITSAGTTGLHTRLSAGHLEVVTCSLNRGGDPRSGPVTIPFATSARPARSVKAPGGTAALLRLVVDVPLPGRAVRFDYQSQDAASGRLYISHMNDGHVEMFDTRARKVVGRVGDTPGVTGVLVVPELKKLYASVTGHHSVAVIDSDSLTVRATLGPIGFPDGIAYAPATKRIFVSDESGGGELVLDGTSDTVVGRIALGGEAGNTKYDAGSGCVLVAVQTLNQIVSIDPVTLGVVGRYAVAGASHPHGLYVDEADRLLFVANEGNATLEVIDLQTLQVADIVPVGEDPDVLTFDPAWHRLYVATESGGLWIYRVEGRSLTTLGALDLPHGHTVSVDSASHMVYLPLQDVDGHPVLRVMAGVPGKDEASESHR